MKKKINFNTIEWYGKNMINAYKKIKIRFSSIVTFTGFDKNNNLKKIGDLAFFVVSKTYNMVENIHQMWLLSIIDCLANKSK